MTSRIDFKLLDLSEIGIKGGAAVRATLVSGSGQRVAPVNLAENAIQAAVTAAAEFDQNGETSLTLVRASSIPADWTYTIEIVGPRGGGIWKGVRIPDGNRNFVQVLAQHEPGTVPNLIAITQEEYNQLLDEVRHEAPFYTGQGIGGNGLQATPLIIADLGVTLGKLAQAVQDTIGGSVALASISGGIGEDPFQITFRDNEGTGEKIVTLPIDARSLVRELSTLTGNDRLPVSAVSGVPDTATLQAAIDAVQAAVDRNAQNVGHLRDFEQSLMSFTSFAAASGWTQAASNAASRLAGRPTIPAGLPDTRMRVTIGGEGSGSHVFQRADLIALTATVGQQLSASNAITWEHDGNNYFVSHDGSNEIIVASDTIGAFTAAFDVAVVRITKEQIDTAQQLPDPVAGQFVKWNAGGTALENTPEPEGEDAASWAEADNTDPIPASKLTNAPTGTDEARVNQLIAAGVSDWAEADNTDLIPGAKLNNAPLNLITLRQALSSILTGRWVTEADLPRKLDDLLDAVDEAGWMNEGNSATEDAWVESVPAGGSAQLSGSARTLAQAQAATYAQSFEVSPRATDKYLALRVPTDIEAKQLRLLVGGETYSSDTWTELGTAGSYRYYTTAVIRFLPVGATVRLQRYDRFELDRARIYLEDGRIPGLTAADALKWLQVNAGADGFEFVDAPSGGGGGDSTPPAIQTLRNAGNVSITPTGADAWTDWSDVATFTVSAAQAGVALINAHYDLVLAGAAGGGNRCFWEGRLVKQESGQADVTEIEARDYLRAGGNFGTNTSAASQTDSGGYTFFETLAEGDTYRMQIRIIVQGVARTVTLARTMNFLQTLTNLGGGGGSGGGLTTQQVTNLINAAVPVARRIPAFTSADAGESVRVNAAGTGLEVSAVPVTPPTQAQVYAQSKEILQAGTNVTLTTDDDDSEITINASGGGGADGTGTTLPASPSQGDTFQLTANQTIDTGAVMTAATSSWLTGWSAVGTPEIGSVNRHSVHGLSEVAWVSASGLSVEQRRIIVGRSALAPDAPKTPARVIIDSNVGDAAAIAGVSHNVTPLGASDPETWRSAAVANPFTAGSKYRIQVYYTDGTRAYPQQTYEPGLYAWDGEYWRPTTEITGDEVVDLLQGQPENRRLSARYIRDLPAQTHVERVHSGPGIGLSVASTNASQRSPFTLFSPVFDLDDVTRGEFAVSATLTISTRSNQNLAFFVAGNPLHERHTDVLFATELKALAAYDVADDDTWVSVDEVYGLAISGSAAGFFRVALGHNAAGQLGYVLLFAAQGTHAANLAVGINLNVDWSPTDAPAQATDRIAASRLPEAVEEFHSAVTIPPFTNEGNVAGDDAQVGSRPFNGIPTLAQARGEVYGQTYTRSGALNATRYLPLRRPHGVPLAELRLVQVRGGNNFRIIPGADWASLGDNVAGSVAFYSAAIPNMANGDVFRLQRSGKFEFDTSAVSVTGGIEQLGTTSGRIDGNTWTNTSITEAMLDQYTEIGLTQAKANTQVTAGVNYNAVDAPVWARRSDIGKQPSVNTARFPQYLLQQTVGNPGGSVHFVNMRVSSGGVVQIASTITLTAVSFIVLGRK